MFRRIFACCAVLFLCVSLSRAEQETFYLGTFTKAPGGSQGIYIGTLDSETGNLGPLRVAAKETNPNFLALSSDHRFLFAALDEAVESFAVQPNGTLRALNSQPAGGTSTCHVSLDKTTREVFVASYGSGTIAAFPVGADGMIGPSVAHETFTGSGPNPTRQKKPFAHSIYTDPENKFVYACDLGTDKIWIYQLGAKGELTAASPAFAMVPPGSGPRHLLFDGAFVYVVNEMGVTTSVFLRTFKTGALDLLETVQNIEGGAKPGSTSAEIAMHPSGQWLYVSTRGQDVISVFHIERNRMSGGLTPRLTFVQNVPSPTIFPRNFGLDPTGHWMIVAGQNGNTISVMKIDTSTGKLSPTPETASVGSPVCVLFVPEKSQPSEAKTSTDR